MNEVPFDLGNHSMFILSAEQYKVVRKVIILEFLKDLLKRYTGIPPSADSVDYYQHYNIEEWIEELETGD